MIGILLNMYVNQLVQLQLSPGGGTVDTLVLGTSAERRESSNLSWGTNFFYYFGKKEVDIIVIICYSVYIS